MRRLTVPINTCTKQKTAAEIKPSPNCFKLLSELSIVMMNIREIQASDWQDILALQERAYTEVSPEPLSVLQDKEQHSNGTCLVCISATGKLVGYLLSHPWGSNHPPKLHAMLDVSAGCESIFLHDLAVDPSESGKGFGGALVHAFLALVEAQQHKSVLLVAVQGAEKFWNKYGFEVKKAASSLDGYGENAVLMERVAESVMQAPVPDSR
jgi:ribosomal protein S18 acetylase RimI-like enzyme